MDIGVVIGSILAWAMVLVTMILSGGVGTYIDIPSFILVVIGSICIWFMSFPLGNVLGIGGVLGKMLFFQLEGIGSVTSQMVQLATTSRKEGILALEALEGQIKDPFLRTGIRLMVDGTEPEVIQEILEIDLEHTEERHRFNSEILGSLGDIGPAMGMLGTLIGLVGMLKNMSDPTAIGPSMAVALITTLYGSMMANLFGLPYSKRLSVRNKEEMLVRAVQLTGILSIQAGLNPRIVEQKLLTFLPPALRKSQFD